MDVPAGVEPWSRHIPDGLLLDRLCFETGGCEAELLERVAATENLRAVIDARQVRELAGLVAAQQAECPRDEVVRSVATQVAVTTGITHGAALRRVEEALTLTFRLPEILAALGQARVNYQSARVILEEFTGLADPLLEQAQTQILERVAGRNHSQIRRCAKRVVAGARTGRWTHAVRTPSTTCSPALNWSLSIRIPRSPAGNGDGHGLGNGYTPRSG